MRLSVSELNRKQKAIRGGEQRNEAAVAWNVQERARRATAEDELAVAILHYFRLLYPGQEHVPATELVFWQALSDVTGVKEGHLTKRAAELGIWPWSSTEVMLAVREVSERQAA